MDGECLRVVVGIFARLMPLFLRYPVWVVWLQLFTIACNDDRRVYLIDGSI